MINEKETCDKLLASMLGSWELAEQWWNSPNKAFNGEHPIDVFETDKRKVVNYLFHHAYAGGGS